MNIVFINPQLVARIGFLKILKAHNTNLTVIASETLKACKIQNPAIMPLLVIISVKTATQDPLNLVEQCRIVYPGTSVIFYDEDNMHAPVSYIFELGIEGYTMATEPISEFLRCIDIVSEGSRYLSPFGWASLLNQKRKTRHILSVKLGRREHQIATYLVTGKSTTWIANELGRKPSTISSIKKTIFRKMNVTNVIELIHGFEKYNRAVGQ